MFSDMVWSVEYDILELNQHDRYLKQDEWCNGTVFDCPSALPLLRDAFIIYSYIAFRDQNSTSLYKRLAGRLEQYAFELVEALQSLSALPLSEAVLLLWVMYTGWKGATLAKEPTSWLTSQAAHICRVLGLGGEKEVSSHMRNLVWNEENDVTLWPTFWNELKKASSRLTVV